MMGILVNMVIVNIDLGLDTEFPNHNIVSGRLMCLIVK